MRVNVECKALQALKCIIRQSWQQNLLIRMGHIAVNATLRQQPHYSKSQFFCLKIQFRQNPNIFTSFSPKIFFDIFSHEIKVVNS